MAARLPAWRWLTALIAAVPVAWLASPGGHPNELRVFAVPLVIALVLGLGRPFLRDFVPLAIGVFAYEWCRTLAHRVHPSAFYRPQLDADRLIGLGRTPTARFQGWFFDGHLRWPDDALIFLHSLNFAAPLAVLFAIWLTCRPLYVQSAVALLATSFAAAIVFVAYPAAPPWLAARAGLLHGVVRIRALDGPLVSHGTVQHLFDDNPVAAVPSLHAAYALLVVLMIHRMWPRLTPLAVLYALAMHFGVVYLGEHYVSDLIAGDVLVLVVWWAVGRSRFASSAPSQRFGGRECAGWVFWA
ncbi:MAG: phosphatase PAP2 family protein [Gaiellales bacterium]